LEFSFAEKFQTAVLFDDNNNIQDNVYGAVIMSYCHHVIRAIARVHPVHLMNVERRQAAADPRPSQTTCLLSVIRDQWIFPKTRQLLNLI